MAHRYPKPGDVKTTDAPRLRVAMERCLIASWAISASIPAISASPPHIRPGWYGVTSSASNAARSHGPELRGARSTATHSRYRFRRAEGRALRLTWANLDLDARLMHIAQRTVDAGTGAGVRADEDGTPAKCLAGE